MCCADLFLSPSPPQVVTVNKLQHLWQQLTHSSPGADSGSSSTSGLTLVDAVDEGLGGKWKLWGLLTGKGGSDAPDESESPVKGLYLYGGVGSGKTMLMDLFYDTLPPSVRKKRVRRPRPPAQTALQGLTRSLGRPQVHFHDFMLDVHRRLREQKAMEDPLRAVAEVSVTCSVEGPVAYLTPCAARRILCARVAAPPKARRRCCAWTS